MLKKFSHKFGFTETEGKVIIFFTAILLVGAGSKIFLQSPQPKLPASFDYSEEDSLFALAETEINLPVITKEKSENVDYKQEVLDFNKQNFQKNKSEPLPEEKSVDLNSATLEVLLTLPGIGKKTAENIVIYRNSNGKFNSLDDLLNVKGIGKSKLSKIKKYLYIQ